MKKITLLLLLLLFAAGSYAQSVGINSDGTAPDGSAMLDVKSTNKGFLPPRMTQTERNAISNPPAGLVIYNTTTNKPNYFNGTYWMNYDGTVALSIGDAFQGGIVAYIYVSGDPGYDPNVPHGLIAATTNDEAYRQWYNSTSTTGATATAIGTGLANTNAIISVQGTSTDYAARYCADYTSGGYDDWFLPSLVELQKLYESKQAIGGFAQGYNYYWSSSEVNNSNARMLNGSNGSSTESVKSNSCWTRPVRYF